MKKIPEFFSWHTDLSVWFCVIFTLGVAFFALPHVPFDGMQGVFDGMQGVVTSLWLFFPPVFGVSLMSLRGQRLHRAVERASRERGALYSVPFFGASLQESEKKAKLQRFNQGFFLISADGILTWKELDFKRIRTVYPQDIADVRIDGLPFISYPALVIETVDNTGSSDSGWG